MIGRKMLLPWLRWQRRCSKMGNKYYVENPKKFILEFLDDQFDKDLN